MYIACFVWVDVLVVTDACGMIGATWQRTIGVEGGVEIKQAMFFFL
jgi:hypothetical protein